MANEEKGTPVDFLREDRAGVPPDMLLVCPFYSDYFFLIDSLGVIPKYSLYLLRKFFTSFNPIISGMVPTGYFPLSNNSCAFSIRIASIKTVGASPVSVFHLL